MCTEGSGEWEGFRIVTEPQSQCSVLSGILRR